MADDVTGIWLEVSNARFEGKSLTAQLKGDRRDRDAAWWPVANDAYEDEFHKTFRAILDGLDKKRIVLARLDALSPTDSNLQKYGLDAGVTEAFLGCSTVRIQHAESRLA